MVKLGLITAESILVKKDGIDIPCIVLIGRDENNIKLKYRILYKPYCYIKEEDYTKLKEEKLFDFERYAKPMGTFVRGLNKRALTKLEFPTSKWLTQFLRSYTKLHKRLKQPFYTYEADLSKSELLGLRYLIDRGIYSGVNIEDGKLEPIELNCNLRKWYLDFEAYSTKLCSMGLKEEVPIMMASYWDSYREKLRTLWVKNPKWIEPFKPVPLFKDHELYEYESEALLLQGLLDDVETFDPDLITAWNLERYDFPKWKTRMEACKLNPKLLSPFRSFTWHHRPYKLKGRILFDLMRGFKRFTDAELRSYSLAYVIESEKLKGEKVLFKGTPAETWDKYPEIVLRRNVNDVMTMVELDKKYDLVETFDDLRRVFGGLFYEVLMNYRVLDTALMRFVNKKVALRTAYKQWSKKSSYLGAVVIEPKPSMYKWIAQFDFSREYPSIIKAFNIGPETYRKDGSGFYKIEAPDGTIHSFVKNPKSLLAQLIDEFFKQRDKYEVEYSKAIKANDKTLTKVWWRRVFNIKKMTNAIYGVMAYPSFRLSKEECSMAVALIGREGIYCLRDTAEKHGYTLIYGDTDSVFIQLKAKYGEQPEQLLKEAQELSTIFNKTLTNYFVKKYKVEQTPSDLGLKQLYSRFLLIARKYYAGKYIWDEKKGWKEDYNFKGMEIVRSDSSDLEKEVLETIVKKLLSGESIVDIKEYWSTIIVRFNKRKYNCFEVSFPLQITKPFRFYAANTKGEKGMVPAHVRAALYSNKFLNTDFTYGDKPKRLSIKPSELVKDQWQRTLFEDEIYPSSWTTELGEYSFKWPLKDISIAEDMTIPEWFLKRIDWDRIFRRLSNKVQKLLALVGDYSWANDGVKEK